MNLDNPETLAGMIDAAASDVAQIRVALMFRDNTRAALMAERAERMLFNATCKLHDELPSNSRQIEDALHKKLDFYTVSITRARSADELQDGYMAYLSPSFGASSGVSHEVWAPSFDGAMAEIKRVIAIEGNPKPTEEGGAE